MSKTVKVPACHHDVAFEFAPDGAFVYTGCCGAKLPRRTAKKLRKALKKWLKTRA